MTELYCPFDVETDPAVFGLREEFFETPFGKLYTVRTEQPRTDEATLFLHGVASSWTTWTPLFRAAQERATPIADAVLVDLPGFGRSENRLGHLESRQVAAAVGKVIRGLGYARVRLVGHSMGGLLALDMAARPQAQLPVSSLHLVSGAAFTVVWAATHRWLGLLRSPIVSTLFWSQYALARSRTTGRLAQGLNRRRLLAPLLRPLVAHPRKLRKSVLTALVSELRPDSFRHAATNIVGYDARSRWSELTCPVYAVFGQRDHLVPSSDRAALTKVYPRAKQTVVADAAHFVHMERPGETLDALAVYP